MTYVYDEVTISGGNFDVEGTSACLNQFVDTMTTAGWVLEDDRRDQPGTTSTVTTHKVVLHNDGGEIGTDPNLYITMTSGNSATQNSNFIQFQLHLAYDVGPHTIPSSGLPLPDSTNPATFTKTISVDSNGYTNMWLACDKDSLICFVNSTATIDYTVMFGRVDRFMNSEDEPYATYLASSASHASNLGSVHCHIGNNPVQKILTGSDAIFTAASLNIANEPRTGLGQDKFLYSALPLLFTIDDASPILKGAIGYVKNVFTGVGNTSGLPRVGRAVVSGTGEVYTIFSPGTVASYIRNT